MGALGGSLLGLGGLEGWDSARSLSDGDGFESKPDGKVSASAINLLINATDNMLINNMGDVRLIGTPSAQASLSIDMSSGLPASLTARNGQAFVNTGSFTETSPLFTDPANGDTNGFWSTVDAINGAQPFDIRYTFAWTTDATGFPEVRPGVGVFAPGLSIDTLSPYSTWVFMNRQAPLIASGRISGPDNNGLGSFDQCPSELRAIRQ
jgi:hypothetical protein